jgi:dolichol-phosphate mannosyltransferase
LYVVVPVLDEAPNMPRLLEGLREIAAEVAGAYAVHVVLVDDGSRDGTAERARELSGTLDLEVLRHPRNLGPGRAFATGFAHVAPRLRPLDFVVTMEGDNTSRHELLGQMLTRTREGYEVVLASPYLYGGGIMNTTTWRVVVSHVANAFVKEALGIHGIVTMSSFYRLYAASALRRLQAAYGPGILERAGFESMVELIMKMTYVGVTLSEVAMVLDTSRRVGKSKLKFFRTVMGYLLLWKDKARWRSEAAGARTAGN